MAEISSGTVSRKLSSFGDKATFSSPEGVEAYLQDLPNAETHRLDSGHFAVEDSLEEIASNIKRFHEEKVATGSASAKRKTA